MGPVPDNRCRGKDPSSKTPLWTFITVFFISIFLNLGVMGQVAQNCPNCVQEDVKAIGLDFNVAGGVSCLQANENAGGDLVLNVDVTSNTRYGFTSYMTFIQTELKYGGGGSYNPSAIAGNAVYTPSAAEKLVGS